MDFVGCRAVKLKIPCQYHHVVACGGHGLAGVLRFQQSQLFSMVENVLRHFEHQATTL